MPLQICLRTGACSGADPTEHCWISERCEQDCWPLCADHRYIRFRDERQDFRLPERRAVLARCLGLYLRH